MSLSGSVGASGDVNTGPPAWVTALSLWEWYEIPDTALSDTPPSATTYGSASNKVNSWCGATLRRLESVYIIGGAGGHADYAGNEVNTLKLNTANPVWAEATPPTPQVDIINKSAFYLDDRPAPTHTYWATQYFDDLDKMVIFLRGGITWGGGGPASEATGSDPYYSSGVGDTGDNNDRFCKEWDYATQDWVPVGDMTIAPFGSAIGMDYAFIVKNPVTGDVIAHKNPVRRKWTKATNTWAATSPGNIQDYAAGVWDHGRDQIIFYGSFSGSTAPAGVDPTTGDELSITFSGDALDDLTAVSGYPGMIHDEENDLYICIYNSGGVIEVRTIDPDTYECTDPGMTGTKPTARTNGIQNSCQYVPELKGFVICTAYSENVRFVRTAL